LRTVYKRVLGMAFGLAGLLIGFNATGRETAYALKGDADTHGRNAIPDYGRVFIQDQVSRLDLKIAASDWQIVIDDMTDMAGAAGGQFGGGQQPGGFPGGGQPPGSVPGDGQPPGGFPGGGQPPTGMPGRGFTPDATAACTNLLEGSACAFGTPPTSGRCVQTADGGALACVVLGGRGGANPVGGAGAVNPGRDDVELLPRTPVYVPADVIFDGETFEHVGFRLKGNSSLVNTWRAGSEKLPFRLNIDGLESRFPESRDQTFFGFTNLSFSNHALDSSYLRAKVVTDLFHDAGLPAPRTAFVRVYLDRGAGPMYLGLYTMIEVPDEPMLDRLFAADSGNLYKPHSTGGRWTIFDKDDFPKKTNEFDDDWTDIQGAIAALNASKQDRVSWRSRLEARFDVGGFLRWLALNTLVANNDAYGGLSAHNYYLYGSPRHRDRLFWIPWDHDLSMSSGGTGIGGAGGGGVQTVDIFHNGINANWPLIRFLMDDPVYRSTYRAHVEDLLATVFEPSRVSAILRVEQARIAPFVIGTEGEDPARTFAGTPQQFDAAVYGPTGLIAYVTNRVAAVRRALEGAQ
jgi:spore coat protein H